MAEPEETVEHGDPNSADAKFHRAMNALYIALPEDVARDVNDVVYARYTELKCELADLRARPSLDVQAVTERIIDRYRIGDEPNTDLVDLARIIADELTRALADRTEGDGHD